MKLRIETIALVVAAYFIGLASALFLLPFWVRPFLAAASGGNPADWIGFAGNFGAGIMTIVAAFAAWFAVQRQIAAQDRLDQKEIERSAEQLLANQSEAKFAAVLVITQTVHAAAAVMFVMNEVVALLREVDPHSVKAREEKIGVVLRNTLRSAMRSLDAAMDHWSIPQAWQGLGIEDRANYLILTATLHTVLILHKNPPAEGHIATIEAQHQALGRFGRSLRAFDDELADIFARDSTRA